MQRSSGGVGIIRKTLQVRLYVLCLPHTVRVTVTFLVDLIYSVSVLIIYMSLCVIDVHRGREF